jgi:radical SAM protein with 4Fe4S-binding SPASM domain
MNKICYAPWSNVEILPGGSILPCCKFVDHHYEERFNITTHDISDHQRSQKLITIKQEMLDGQWPKGCDRCRIEEDANIQSRRQMDYERWQHHYQDYDLNSNELLTVGIAIGNVCNLKCITCSPHASSRWQKEYQDVYRMTVPVIEEVRKSFVNSLTDRAPGLVHLDIHGGEPFLSGIDEHEQLLDYYIANGQAKNISIHYTTNGTIWPSNWFQRWQHFREIDLQISIDGVGERFEYMRYPAAWSTLVENVNRYLEHERSNQNFRISVAHTVSAFNVYYIDEFVNWCAQVGLPKPWMGKLHNPSFLRPSAWHSTAKQCIINKLNSSQVPEVRDWAQLVEQNDDSDQFDNFKQYIQRHDQYRQLRYQDTFAELGKFL